ncbi:IS1182 family transposase [Exiguobacterium aurantiacum]|uniref:IS1182 family transposase n=4 Tax=Exiguobacterium TaxID=33986 RepID=UPI0008779FBD|nr:IS1182 family transposase [Exiguobacterium aurantiacum]
MMPDLPNMPPSPYAALYDLLIPADDELRLIHDLVSFDFVTDLLADTYCHDNGRMAVHPVRMFKYLFLKAHSNLSDVDLVRRARTDLTYKYFLDLAPEDGVINPSSLTKFRRQRMDDDKLLDKLLAHTVEVVKEMGLLKGRTLIVDSTHSRARYGQKPIGQAIIEEAKHLRQACYQASADAKGRFPEKVDEHDNDQLLAYALAVAETVESEMPELMMREHIRDRVNRVRELAEDAHVELQVSKDSDARTGHKSADSSFFGYKHHLAMTEEGIITAVVVTSGEAADGKQLTRLIEKSHAAGAEFDHIVGDAAYSGRDNLIYAASQGCKLVAPLNPRVYSPAENRGEGFTYNKDAERYVCPAGHMAIRKARTGTKNIGKNQKETHYFDIELCKRCPLREGCYKDGANSKTYSVSLKSREHSEQLEYEQTDEFKDHHRKRFAIEPKNSQLKNPQGLARNKTSDLKGMTLQSVMAIIAVNLKRIITLSKEKTG